jgi:hypothetical protein
MPYPIQDPNLKTANHLVDFKNFDTNKYRTVESQQPYFVTQKQ